MLNSLPVLVCVGAGLVGGVFFAFSSFVMRALGALPSAQGVAAMQRINQLVLNPLFLGVFIGTTVFAGVCVAAGLLMWGSPKAVLLLAAGLSHVVGSFGVTAAFNVPRNERLAKLPADSAEAAAYWPIYLKEWLFWNHVRTLASVIAAVTAAVAIAH